MPIGVFPQKTTELCQTCARALWRLRRKRYRDLYEIRIRKDQVRVFLFFHKDMAVLVHGVKKAGKSARTRMDREYETSLQRRLDWLEREGAK
jgi:hypothetical protein